MLSSPWTFSAFSPLQGDGRHLPADVLWPASLSQQRPHLGSCLLRRTASAGFSESSGSAETAPCHELMFSVGLTFLLTLLSSGLSDSSLMGLEFSLGCIKKTALLFRKYKCFPFLLVNNHKIHIFTSNFKTECNRKMVSSLVGTGLKGYRKHSPTVSNHPVTST